MSLYEKFAEYVAGDVTAIRAITKLQPVGGPSSKVYAPTYKDGKNAAYATETRWSEGQRVDSVLLDSIQSQANRMELALLNACQDGRLNLPLFTLDVPGHGTLTALDVPHRVHDAIFRDSLWGGKPFRQSPEGHKLVAARTANATAFFNFCPTALLFGTWDSQSGGGANAAKVPRAIGSEIVGLDVVIGKRTASRIDPLGIKKDEGTIYKAASNDEYWTLEEAKAEKDKFGKPMLFKKGKPSEINHGNIPPTIAPGGFTIREALQTMVLSLTQLRRLRFPLDDGTDNPHRDAAGRAVLGALGLYAFLLACEEGLDLRSRCHLVASHAPKFEVIRRVLGEPETFSADSSMVKELLDEALAAAKAQRLEWNGGPIKLTPTDKLLKLVKLSDQSAGTEDDG